MDLFFLSFPFPKIISFWGMNLISCILVVNDFIFASPSVFACFAKSSVYLPVCSTIKPFPLKHLNSTEYIVVVWINTGRWHTIITSAACIFTLLIDMLPWIYFIFLYFHESLDIYLIYLDYSSQRLGGENGSRRTQRQPVTMTLLFLTPPLYLGGHGWRGSIYLKLNYLMVCADHWSFLFIIMGQETSRVAHFKLTCAASWVLCRTGCDDRVLYGLFRW